MNPLSYRWSTFICLLKQDKPNDEHILWVWLLIECTTYQTWNLLVHISCPLMSQLYQTFDCNTSNIVMYFFGFSNILHKLPFITVTKPTHTGSMKWRHWIETCLLINTCSCKSFMLWQVKARLASLCSTKSHSHFPGGDVSLSYHCHCHCHTIAI